MKEKKLLQPKVRFRKFAGENAVAWEQCRLGSVAIFNPKSTLPDEFEYVDLESVVGTDMIAHRTETKDNAPSRAQRLALYGDVFYQTVRPYQKNNCLYDLPYDNYVFSTGYAQMRPNIDSYFLLSRLQEEGFVKLVLDRCTGTSYPAINSNDLADIEIKVPVDRDEQSQVGSLFRSLDHLITLHQRELENIKVLKKTMLSKMFPKNNSKYPEIRFHGFAEAWEQRKLGEILKEFCKKSKVENEYTVLSSTNNGMEVRDGRVSGASNLGYKIIQDEDLVLSPQNLWLGNININDIGTGLVSPSYKTFRFVNVNHEFIKPQLRKPRMLEEYKNASTQGASVVRRNLEMDSFYQIQMQVPNDKEEQEQIGSFFKQLDNLITLHQREFENYKTLKQTLLSKMFI